MGGQPVVEGDERKGRTVAQEEFGDMAVSDAARLGAIKAQVSASPLYNENLAPTEPEERTWTTYNIAALWIGMGP